jgi:hypothetical protein
MAGIPDWSQCPAVDRVRKGDVTLKEMGRAVDQLPERQ